MAESVQNLLARAVALHQAGRLAEARALYQAILTAEPRQADALHLLGVTHFQTGEPAEAVTLIGKAIAIAPNNPSQYQNIALAYRALGRPEDALAHYAKAIARNPAYADAYSNRGVLLQEMGRFGSALADYDQALQHNPMLAEAWTNRGAVLRAMGRLEDAVASCERALALNPNFAAAHVGLGAALHALKRHDEALASYSRAIALQPDFADAYNNRGTLLRELRQLDAALKDFEAAVALNPAAADAYINRAPALRDLKRLDEAVESYAQALALRPGADYLPGYLLHTKMMLCDWRGFDEALAGLLAGIAAAQPVVTPFALLGLVDDPQLQKQVAQTYTAAKYPRSHEKISWTAAKQKPAGEKIRIGYYSADFHNHATAYLLIEALESHDKERFEITAFSFGPDSDDAMRQRLLAAFDGFIDVRDRSDRQIALLSREKRIDIAVDLKGHTQDSRPGIFAAGCAPIQAQYLGYPGTFGADYIHYLIGDGVVTPKGSEGGYAEKLVRLPHSYQANDARRAIAAQAFTRAQMGLPEHGFVFCCFNNAYKILPATFASWMRILKAVDGSMLWLLADHSKAAQNLRAQAEAHGVAAERLVFAERMPLAEHLSRHRLADLMLDTLPYNAHTTASDALWAGVPLVTCRGNAFAARVAASLLRAVGLPELITDSEAACETLAIDLARDPAKLKALRDKLAENKKTAPLFDGKLMARHLEAAFTAMQDRRAAGLAPDTIEVPA
jgi:predicted O-linked N-acetylglucosamine transferase (SPINDLY family)